MLTSVLFTVLALPFTLVTARVIDKRAQCCPRDTFNDTGALINTFAFFTCAYPAGACDWAVSGALENTAQQNCPGSVTCENSQCTCPVDNTGAPGRLINMESQGIQCAYPHGACSFSEDGELFDAAGQINCPQTNNCVASS